MPKTKVLYGASEYNPVIGFSIDKLEIDIDELPNFHVHSDGSVTGVYEHGEWFNSFAAAKKYYVDKMVCDMANLKFQVKMLRATKKEDVRY